MSLGVVFVLEKIFEAEFECFVFNAVLAVSHFGVLFRLLSGQLSE